MDKAFQTKLSALLRMGRRFLEGRTSEYTHREFCEWVEGVADLLREAEPESGLEAEWSSLSASPLVVANTRMHDIPQAIAGFTRAVQVRLQWLGELPTMITNRHRVALGVTQQSRRVFVVHGRDTGARSEVALVLSRLDFEPIILREMPNRGRTVIQKFIDYADVKFAVVLMTGDDCGYLKAEPDKLEIRARQNVILELGFFLGRLGPENVCALYEHGVTVPSDYQGVAFVEYVPDANGWKFELVRELAAAGFTVDANRLLKK